MFRFLNQPNVAQILLATLLFSAPQSILGEWIELKSGEIVEGQLIETGKKSLKVKTSAGILEIEKSNVRSVHLEQPMLPARPTPSAANSNNQDQGPTNDQIELSNPFYFPYARAVQIDVSASFARNTLKTEIASDQFTTKGLVRKGSAETIQTATALSASVRYGISDRFHLGVSGTGYVHSTTVLNGQGSLATATPEIPRQLGATEPTFQFGGRIGGIRQNETYFDLIGRYTPGIKSTSNSALGQRHTFSATALLGRQIGFLTAGVAGSYLYSPAADTGYGYFPEAHLGAGSAVLQLDSSYVFLRLTGGLQAFLNSENNSNPVNGKPIFAASTEFGFKLGPNFLAVLGVAYTHTRLADVQDSTNLRYSRQVGANYEFSLGLTAKL
jgi:hypothetical protein